MEVVWHPAKLERSRRWENTNQKGGTVWLTGLSGSGKSSVAFAAEQALVSAGRMAYVLDGDNLRFGLNADLGFSPEDRNENVRRVAEVARLMADAGCVVLVPLISPYKAARAAAREMHDKAGLAFLEVYMDTPLELCIERDPKGMYKKAQAGQIKGFTGIDDPYEEPKNPDLRLTPEDGTEAELALRVIGALDEMLDEMLND